MKIRLDLHTHSEGSFDGKEPIDLMLDHAEDIDIEGIAITDHDNIEKSLEAVEKADEYEDLIVIPGVEVSTSHGHLLAINVEEKPEEGRDFMDAVEEIRQLGGAAIVPHPFQKTRHGVSKRRIKDCDAVEIYNSWYFTGTQNKRAKKFAENNGYPKAAGSDAHTINSIGIAYTVIDVEADSLEEVGREDIIKSLKEGGNNVEGMRAPLHKSFYHYVKAVLRKTFYYSSKTLDRINNKLEEYTIVLKQYKKVKSMRN